VESVRVLVGHVPTVPETMDEGAIRGLRSPNGEPPCSDGLKRGLVLLGGEQTIRTSALLEMLDDSDADWARSALGIADSAYTARLLPPGRSRGTLCRQTR
jgi:hypothetical protein